MLQQLYAEALALIATTPTCTLSTSGPAGLQASVVACNVHNQSIYILVASTVDHLFNLEHVMEVVLTSPLWQVRGAAPGFGTVNGPAPEDLCACAHAAGATLFEVVPIRIHLEPTNQRRYRETLDIATQRLNPSVYDARAERGRR